MPTVVAFNVLVRRATAFTALVATLALLPDAVHAPVVGQARPVPSDTTPETTSAPAAATVAGSEIGAVEMFVPLRPAPAPRGARLVEADDFGGTVLRTDRWFTCYPQLAHLPSCYNEGNDEQQGYLAAQVATSGGALVLTATNEPLETALAKGGTKLQPYRSGMVASQWDFTYGYLEIRARLPVDAGLWPALWLLPSDGTWPPEIDLVELMGRRNGELAHTFHRGPGTAFSGAEPQLVTALVDPRESHTYGLLWRPEAVTWFIDDTPVFAIAEHVPTKPMRVLANLAVGGSYVTPVDEATVFPATMRIEWVRLWQ